MKKNSQTIDKDIVRDTIEKLIQNITKKSKLPMLSPNITRRQANSATKIKRNKYYITVSMQKAYQHNIKNQMPTEDFIDIVISCFHEERHLQQAYEFQQSKCTPELRQMAHTDLIRKTIPEAYSTNHYPGKYYDPKMDGGYWHNKNEINAELYGILKTRNFFHTYFSEIDVDQHLVNLFQNKRPWYADTTQIQSYDDLIQRLKTAEQQAEQIPIQLPIRYPINNQYSKNLQAFAAKESRRIAYIKAYDQNDGETTNKLLLDFIRQERPWRFRNYPCLQDEWNEHIRTANPSPKERLTGNIRMQPTITHPQRLKELENKFGHIKSNQDQTQYEP